MLFGLINQRVFLCPLLSKLYICRMPILQTYQFPTFEVLIWNVIEPLPFFMEALELTNSELDVLEQKYSNPIACM